MSEPYGGPLALTGLPRIAFCLLLALPFLIFVSPMPLWRWSVPVIAVVVLWLTRLQSPYAAHAVFWGLFAAIVAAGAPWPLMFVLPLAALLLLRVGVPAFREVTGWLRGGRLDAVGLIMAIAIVIVSSLALVVWFYWARPDVRATRAMLPTDLPAAAVIACMVLFSLANATWEEFILKGMMWDALSRLTDRALVINVVQSVFFGLVHWHGFPNGVAGVTLATIYGFMLGVLRERTQSIWPLVAVHFVADLVICGLLFGSRLTGGA